MTSRFTVKILRFLCHYLMFRITRLEFQVKSSQLVNLPLSQNSSKIKIKRELCAKIVQKYHPSRFLIRVCVPWWWKPTRSTNFHCFQRKAKVHSSNSEARCTRRRRTFCAGDEMSKKPALIRSESLSGGVGVSGVCCDYTGARCLSSKRRTPCFVSARFALWCERARERERTTPAAAAAWAPARLSLLIIARQ
jgi:hypothetical protein